MQTSWCWLGRPTRLLAARAAGRSADAGYRVPVMALRPAPDGGAGEARRALDGATRQAWGTVPRGRSRRSRCRVFCSQAETDGVGERLIGHRLSFYPIGSLLLSVR